MKALILSVFVLTIVNHEFVECEEGNYNQQHYRTAIFSKSKCYPDTGMHSRTLFLNSPIDCVFHCLDKDALGGGAQILPSIGVGNSDKIDCECFKSAPSGDPQGRPQCTRFTMVNNQHSGSYGTNEALPDWSFTCQATNGNLPARKGRYCYITQTMAANRTGINTFREPLCENQPGQEVRQLVNPYETGGDIIKEYVRTRLSHEQDTKWWLFTNSSTVSPTACVIVNKTGDVLIEEPCQWSEERRAICRVDMCYHPTWNTFFSSAYQIRNNMLYCYNINDTMQSNDPSCTTPGNSPTDDVSLAAVTNNETFAIIRDAINQLGFLGTGLFVKNITNETQELLQVIPSAHNYMCLALKVNTATDVFDGSVFELLGDQYTCSNVRGRICQFTRSLLANQPPVTNSNNNNSAAPTSSTAYNGYVYSGCARSNISNLDQLRQVDGTCYFIHTDTVNVATSAAKCPLGYSLADKAHISISSDFNKVKSYILNISSLLGNNFNGWVQPSIANGITAWHGENIYVGGTSDDVTMSTKTTGILERMTTGATAQTICQAQICADEYAINYNKVLIRKPPSGDVWFDCMHISTAAYSHADAMSFCAAGSTYGSMLVEIYDQVEFDGVKEQIMSNGLLNERFWINENTNWPNGYSSGTLKSLNISSVSDSPNDAVKNETGFATNSYRVICSYRV